MGRLSPVHLSQTLDLGRIKTELLDHFESVESSFMSPVSAMLGFEKLGGVASNRVGTNQRAGTQGLTSPNKADADLLPRAGLPREPGLVHPDTFVANFGGQNSAPVVYGRPPPSYQDVTRRPSGWSPGPGAGAIQAPAAQRVWLPEALGSSSAGWAAGGGSTLAQASAVPPTTPDSAVTPTSAPAALERLDALDRALWAETPRAEGAGRRNY